MEQSNSRPYVDKEGNKWFVRQNVVILKLANESYERKLGLIFEGRFIVYKTREKHLFRNTNSYGFNYEVIEELTKQPYYIDYVDLYDDFGMYRVPIQVIKEGDVMFFKEQGFEIQRFVTLEVLELYKRELPEDINRKNLMGEGWFAQLRAEFHKPYWNVLGSEVTRRRNLFSVYPDKEDVFKAFKLTSFEEVKIVILGKEPYFNGVADGLAFSSKDEDRIPPALAKIYEALEDDIRFGLYLDQDPSLVKFANQGVLLFNTILTVDEDNPGSHHHLGWLNLTLRVLEVLNTHPHDLVFMLWGDYAKEFKKYINVDKHMVLEAEHPALAVKENRKWLNKDCFNKANKFLEQKGYGEIKW